MTIEVGEKSFFGCLGILAAGIGWGAVSLFGFVSSCMQPSAAELEAKAEEERMFARIEREREAFELRQEQLWRAPLSQLTPTVIAAEIEKCRDDIIKKASQRSPYVLMLDDVDLKAALGRVRKGIPVRMEGQQRLEFPAKVRSATYECHFKGIGYERFTERDPQFMESYVQG